MKVKAQKIPTKANNTITIDEIVALFCVYFPQYKYEEVLKLPIKLITRMVKQYEKVYAKKMLDIFELLITANGHNKSAINKIVDRYKNIIE